MSTGKGGEAIASSPQSSSKANAGSVQISVPKSASGSDFASVFLQNKAAPRSFRFLPTLTIQAFQIVWRAARWQTLISFGLIAGGAVLVTAQVLAAKWVLTVVLREGATRPHLAALWPSVATLTSLAAASLVLSAASGQLRRLLSQFVTRQTTREILETASALSLDAYESPGFFDHLRRVESNAVTRPSEIVSAVAVLLSGLLTAAGLGTVIATTEPIVLPMLILAALPMYTSNRVGSRLEFHFMSTQTPGLRERDYARFLVESRDAAKEIRAYDAGEPLRSRWEARFADYLRGLKTLVRKRVTLSLVGAFGSSAMLAVTMLILLTRVGGGGSLTRAATALVAMRMLASQMQGAAGGLNSLFESRLFLEDYQRFLAYRPEAEATEGDSVVAPPSLVEVDDVSFTYPGASEPSLRNVTLTLRAGEVIALVGENGSGKTTLAKLLAILHTPSSGQIRWNGTDTTQLPAKQLRSHIGVVFQDFLKYAFSVTENVALGRPSDHLDMQRVCAATRSAGADTFIERLPSGYDTRLGKMWPDGVDLSIGQWQSLALSRLFYRDASLIILDEPSAALDPRAEAELFVRMRHLFAGRTVVLISHRFSSARSADKIVVLQGGRIVEMGSHDKLMEADGLYNELFTLQAEAYLGTSRA